MQHPTGSKGPATIAARWNTFVLLAASVHFALAYTLNTSPFLNLTAFEAGQERAPFQYRALTAWIMALADRFIHIPAGIASHLPPRMSEVHSFVLLGIVFASLVATVYATRCALERLTGDRETSRWWALLVIFMAYFHYLLDFGHPCCTPFQLPYDLPSMAFFAVAISLLVAQRMPLFYLCFAIATINRESTLFLILIYLLYTSAPTPESARPSIRTLALNTIGLAAIWLAIRTGLHRLYPDAAMTQAHIGTFEIHIVDNIGYLLRPYYWASYLSMFGFTWIYLYLHWKEVPHPGIRRALWIGPAMLLAMYIVGVLSEIRIFGELISLVAIALTLLVRSRMQNAGDRKPGITAGSTDSSIKGVRPQNYLPQHSYKW